MNRFVLLSLPVLLLLPVPSAAEEPKVTVVLGHLLPAEGGPAAVKPSPLTMPFGVAFDRAGNLFVVELGGGRLHRLTAGKLTTLAGGSKGYAGDGGPAGKAAFNGMHNVAVTPDGDVYIADSWNHSVRKIRRGTVTTFAGTGKAGFAGDGGPAGKARFNQLMCVTLAPDGKALYLADLGNRRIRVIDLKTGIVRTVAGNGRKGVPADGAAATASPLVDPRAVAVDSRGRVYILERSGHALRVVTPDGKIRTVAGTGKPGDADGPARKAGLSGPKHLCVDAADNVYIADERNALIRKYDPRKGTLTTVLGRGQGSPAVRLREPHGVCVRAGQLYVVDSGHNRVLRVELRP
jgi:DNA-binding beta-propeller fold protein YncE